MTQEERIASNLYEAIKYKHEGFVTIESVCNTIANHYDFTPKVKELDWKDCQRYGGLMADTACMNVYHVGENNGQHYYEINGNYGISNSFTEAKSACQEHYRQTVLSLLEI